MSELKTYSCLHKVRHDGELYESGELVELTEEQATPLLGCGSIKVSIATYATTIKPSQGSTEETDDLHKSILKVIPDLDNDADFTQAGTPKVASVSKLLGRDVSSDDIHLAWAEYQSKDAE